MPNATNNAPYPRADGTSLPVPAPLKRTAQNRGKEFVPPAVTPGTRSARAGRASNRDVRGAISKDEAFSQVLKGEPALPFKGWPVVAATESAGGPLLPAGVGSYGPQPETVFSPDDRQRVADFDDTNAFPWRALCRLVITAANGSEYLGTGWLISPRVLVTAGHCVFMHREGGWADRIEVTPAYLDGNAPFGSQTSDDLHAADAWVDGNPQSQSAQQSDYGAIILPEPFDLGYFGYGVYSDAELSGMTVNVYGYPGDKTDGSAVWGNFRKLVRATPQQVFYNISTAGGQSGCAVFVKDGETYTALGIHNYGGSSSNNATRITGQVFNDLEAWKAMGR